MKKTLISTPILLAAAITANAQLSGLVYNSGTGNWEYRALNPISGTTSLLNPFAMPDGFDSFLTDPSGGFAYIQSGSTLYGLNLASGAILNTPTLDTMISGFGVGNGGLVGVAFNSVNLNWEYRNINPITGSTTLLNTFALPYGLIGGSFLTDPSTGSAYLQSGNTLYDLNLASGAILNTPTLDTMIAGYGVGNGGLVGLDFNLGTGNWEYRNINPVTGSTTLLNSFTLSNGYESGSFLTDPSTDSAYFLSGNVLYDLNLASGAILNTSTPDQTMQAIGIDPVPEPSSLALAALGGLASLLGLRKRSA